MNPYSWCTYQLVTPVFLAIVIPIPRRVIPSRFFTNNIEDGDNKDKTVKDNISLVVTTSVYALLEGRYAKGYPY